MYFILDYPITKIKLKIKTPVLAPILSKMNPPINGSIILGNEYTEYNKLNYVVDKCNFPFSIIKPYITIL